MEFVPDSIVLEVSDVPFSSGFFYLVYRYILLKTGLCVPFLLVQFVGINYFHPSDILTFTVQFRMKYGLNISTWTTNFFHSILFHRHLFKKKCF